MEPDGFLDATRAYQDNQNQRRMTFMPKNKTEQALQGYISIEQKNSNPTSKSDT
jgi:hypothetical protein